MMPTVQIKNASLAYGEQLVFSALDMELPAGKWVALLGPSGVGKSSLLRMIAGLTMAEEKVQGMITADNQQQVSEQIAYMAQTDLLFPWLTVLENAMLKIKLSPQIKQDAYRQQAISLLEKVGLGHALHLYPHQLSGGMRQRTALVRTLMDNKPIILMDEPFSALDAITRYKLQALAVELLRDKTVLFVTHDPAEALRLAHHIYIMQNTPAHVKLVTQLTSPTPRELTDSTLVELQASLFNSLSASLLEERVGERRHDG